jgi:Domain of unknown function (DUF4129)
VLLRPAAGTPGGAASVPGGPDAVHQAVRRILARPEFQPTPESPVTTLRRWVLRQLGRLLDDLLGGGRFGVIGALLALAVLGGLVVIIVSAVRGTAANPVRAGFNVSGPRRPAAHWLADAAACEALGDWRGALRCRYRALIAELAQRGLIEEVPGRTTGEYRVAVGEALPASADLFAGATELFEVAWYGDNPDHPTDAAVAARFRHLADGVRAGAR